jgi:hypothetical protein
MNPYLDLDVLAKLVFCSPEAHQPHRAIAHVTLIRPIFIKPHIFIYRWLGWFIARNIQLSRKRIPHNTTIMARLSTVNNPALDPTAINLTRMIARLQRILISPDQDTESKLRSSSLEREKVGTVRQSGPLLLERKP